MRGDNQTEAQKAKQLIADAAVEAQAVLATAEHKKRVSAAIILGPDGSPLFHVISTWWSKMVVIGYGVMLATILILAIVVYLNKLKLGQLEQKVDENKIEMIEGDSRK